MEDTCISSTDPKKPEPNLWLRELTNGIEKGGRLLDATCCMVRHERGAANGQEAQSHRQLCLWQWRCGEACRVGGPQGQLLRSPPRRPLHTCQGSGTSQSQSHADAGLQQLWQHPLRPRRHPGSFFCSNALIALARSLCKCLLAVLITASGADAVKGYLVRCACIDDTIP